MAVLGFRLLLLPLVMLSLAWALGFRGMELFLVLMVFGTPVAASSYPMAQNMGATAPWRGSWCF